MQAVRVDLVPVPLIDSIWPRIADGIERSCQKTGGDLTSDYLWGQCRAGAAYLLVVLRDEDILAATVLRFESWSSGKKLRCLALYGSGLKVWLPHLLQTVSQIARIGGASSLVAEGRPGWERIFKQAQKLRVLYEVNMQ